MPDFEIFKGNTKEILKMFKPKHTLTIFVILLAIVIGIFGASILMFYNNQQKSNTIQSGVYIKGINVSGLTKDEAIALIENELRDKMESPLELTYKNNKYYLEIEQIGAKFDINASVEYALSIAKSGDFFKDLQEYISTLLTNINIEPNLNYNEESLTMYLENIEANLPDQLEEPSYYIEDGEFVVFHGPSGCGKSTILRMIGGLEDITSGKIYLDTELLNDVLPRDRRLSMAFQNYTLYKNFNTYENIALGLRLRNFPLTVIDSRVKTAAKFLGIADILDKKLKSISDAEKQRAALCRAIVCQPKVMLVDEDFARQDENRRKEMISDILKINRVMKITVVPVRCHS